MKYKDYLAFDFDAVISSYERPFKYDSLGEPQQEIIDTMQYYYDKGYYILIFTGRSDTPVIKEWLKKYNVPYHGFNVNPGHWEFTSPFKPYFGVLVDDKAVNFHFSRNKKTSKELITEIDNILENKPNAVSCEDCGSIELQKSIEVLERMKKRYRGDKSIMLLSEEVCDVCEKAIQLFQLTESVDMPEKREYGNNDLPEVIAQIQGEHIVIDLCRAVVVKKDMEIAELKECYTCDNEEVSPHYCISCYSSLEKQILQQKEDMTILGLANINLTTANNEVLVKLDELQQQNTKLETRLQEIKDQFGKVAKEAYDFEKENTKLQQRVDELEKENEIFNKDYKKLLDSYTNEFNQVVSLRAKLDKIQGEYEELILAVCRICDGETRHQTALKYIRNAEKIDDSQEAQAIIEDKEVNNE